MVVYNIRLGRLVVIDIQLLLYFFHPFPLGAFPPRAVFQYSVHLQLILHPWVTINKKRYYKIIPYTICAHAVYNIHITRAQRARTHIHRTFSSVDISGGRLYSRSDTIICIFILSSEVSKILCVRSPWVIFRVVYLLYIYHDGLLLLCYYIIPNVYIIIYAAIIFQFDPIRLPLQCV